MAIVQPIEMTKSGRRRLGVANPATQQAYGEITVDTDVQVRAAIERARAAQAGWAALGFDGRARYLRRALAVLLKNQEDYIKVIRRETGRSKVETLMMEILPSCDSLSYNAKHAKKALADERPGMHLLKTKKLLITYKPLGVVGIITPWNGPFVLSLNPTVQALMAGNAVVLKPSEVTPFSGRLVGELFKAAGLPRDVLTVIDGDGETGAALVNGGVDKIAFTGSVATGRKIGEACGRNLIPCTLELGGKDPCIVCADADLDRAAKGVVFGAFMNTGQFCCSTERVYVVESVADEFIRKVLAEVKALRQGRDGEYDLGPMIFEKQIEIVERQVEDAKKKGATVLTGGKRNAALGGLFYEATLLTDVTHDMAVMTEETFGPVLPIVRVKDEREALRLANDSLYGLSSTLWTRDDDKAIRIGKQIESGSVCVNDSSVTYGAFEAPFGGRKTSGLGQIHGKDGLKGYTFAQPILLDRFNQKEEHVWYPFTAEKGVFLQKLMRWVWGTPIARLLM